MDAMIPGIADSTAAAEELARLRTIEREHRASTLVIGVLVERLLGLTDGDAVEVSDSALEEARPLRAWRDPDRHAVLIALED